MKKIALMLCVIGLAVGITACKGSDVASGEESAQESSDISNDSVITEESIEESTEEESEEQEVIINDIGQDSAEMLIMENLDASVYSVEPDSTEFVADEEEYYIFTLYENGEALDLGVAVNKSSGNLYSYDFEENLGDISEIPAFSGNAELLDFDGTFIKDGVSLVFRPSDTNSFEFSFLVNDEEKLLGVARIDGNTATFDNGSDFVLTFTRSSDEVTVTETGTNSYDVEFAGTYTASE